MTLVLGIWLALAAQDEAASREKWTRAFAELREGTGRKKVQEAVTQARGIHYRPRDRSWGDATSKDYEVWDLDGTWQLLTTYIGDQLQSHRIFGFPDLRPEIEPELYAPVRAVHDAPSLDAALSFDPLTLIRSANALHPLGAEAVLKACEAYDKLVHHRMIGLDTSKPAELETLRSAHRRNRLYDLDEQKIFLLLRVLFESKDGKPGMPSLLVGSAGTTHLPGEANFPLYPLAIVDDVPFMLAAGYSLFGKAESPLAHVAHCREKCVLRKAPLSPGSPVDAVDRLTATPAWKTVYGANRPNSDAGRVRAQALRAVVSLHSAKYHTCGTMSHEGLHHDKEWEEDASAVRAIKPVWDKTKQSFVRP